MKSPEKSSRQKHQQRQEKFQRRVKEKASRKLKARKKGDRIMWYGLGVFGIVGWSVTIPTLLGIALGIWLDLILIDAYSWTLMMMFLGLITGCLNAWYWIKKESQDDYKD